MPHEDAPITQRHSDTDPTELRLSLPPNLVTHADIVSTHRAILDELHGLRIDMMGVRSDISDLKVMMKELLEKTSSLHALTVRQDKIEAVCKYHHPGNGYSPITDEDG